MDDRNQRFAAFLYRGYADWSQEQYEKDRKQYENRGRRGSPPRLKSQTAFALNVLGVNQASFSQWVGGMRIPDEENKAKLAEFYGPELYRILDEPEMLPKSMRHLAEIWPDLTDDEKKATIEYAQELAERKQKKAPEGSTEME